MEKLQPYNADNLKYLNDAKFIDMYNLKHKFKFFGDISAIEERAKKLGLVKQVNSGNQ